MTEKNLRPHQLYSDSQSLEPDLGGRARLSLGIRERAPGVLFLVVRSIWIDCTVYHRNNVAHLLGR